MADARSRHPAHGFTLIELLVVIAIISLLVSILLPSMTRARDMAQSTVCLTNVRRLGLANQFYLNDYGVFPPVRLSFNRDGSTFVNSYGAERPRWQWFLDQGVGPAINPQPFGGGVFGDAQSTTITNDYFSCPSHTGEFDRDIRNGAYGYNHQYLGDSRVVSGGRYTNFPVRSSEILHPASTVLLGDSRGGDVPHGGHSYTLDPPRLAVSRGVPKHGPTVPRDGPIGHSPASARHLGRANIAFVDGSARSLTLPDLGYSIGSDGTVVPDGPGSTNRLWSGDLSEEW